MIMAKRWSLSHFIHRILIFLLLRWFNNSVDVDCWFLFIELFEGHSTQNKWIKKQSIENIDKWNSSSHQFSFCWVNRKKCVSVDRSLCLLVQIQTHVLCFMLFLILLLTESFPYGSYLLLLSISSCRQILMCTQ